MKPRYKYNNGNGAQICRKCSTIIHTGRPSNMVLCGKCADEYIYYYPTKHKEGFITDEMLKLIYDLHLGRDRFFDKLGVNTAMVKDGDWITFHEDVARTARIIIQRREMYLYEWD